MYRTLGLGDTLPAPVQWQETPFLLIVPWSEIARVLRLESCDATHYACNAWENDWDSKIFEALARSGAPPWLGLHEETNRLTGAREWRMTAEGFIDERGWICSKPVAPRRRR